MKVIINRFLNHLESDRQYALNTLLAYKADLTQFVQVLTTLSEGIFDVREINQEVLGQYNLWLNRQGYKTSTVARKIAAVRTFLDYLHHHEGVQSRPLLDTLQLPQAQRETPQVLTVDEIHRLIEAASGVESPRARRDYAALALLYATGLRAAEVVNLEIGDVDLQSGLIVQSASLEETIPLGQALNPLKTYIEKSRPYLVRSPDVQALFINQRGNRISRQGLWLIVKRWAAKAGLSSDVSPQTIRHSLARHLLDQGISRSEVQKMLRLSSPNTLWLHKRFGKVERLE